jgi:hypothetical protein
MVDRRTLLKYTREREIKRELLEQETGSCYAINLFHCGVRLSV